MSSLYYQHRQHEQQQQQQHEQRRQQDQHRDRLRREREERPHEHYHYHSQSHPQEPRPQHYHEAEPPSQQHYHYSNRYENREAFSDASFSNHPRTSHENGPASPPNLPPPAFRDDALDTLLAMMSQERTGYHLDSYFPGEVQPRGNGLPRQQNIIHGGWREKICQWSYNVVDHFDLPREIVSISLNYFDRYMATLSTSERPSSRSSHSKSSGRSSPPGSGDLALLASLGTLHLATKVHATNHNDFDPALGTLEEQHHKVPSLSTLANLSRGQFGPSSILEMEKLLLKALRWRLHPPTLYAFVTLLLKLIPTTHEDPTFGLKPSIASELFEVAMYVAELSVCDAFFVERQIPPSTIALAAICTAMDDLLRPQDASVASSLLGSDASYLAGTGRFTEHHRSGFLRSCSEYLGLGKSSFWFGDSLERLRSMYLGASALKPPEADTREPPSSSQTAQSQQQQQQGRQRTNSYNPPTSPSSIADMSLSTINSNIHSMAGDNSTIKDGLSGGNSACFKRGDSMVSSIACQSKGGEIVLTNDDDDELLYGDEEPNPSPSDNFRYSPSPPRDGNVVEPSENYPEHRQQLRYTEDLRRNPNLMSCSPIVAMR